MFNVYSDALRIYLASNKRKRNGWHKYTGKAVIVCKKIISDCWNGSYLKTSAGHFSQFWTRDFGWCSESLCRNGYRKQVTASLKYALDKFATNKDVTTTIRPNGYCYDALGYSVDSVPWLVRAVRNSKSKEILETYSKFLEVQAKQFFNKTIDAKDGLVKVRQFSSIKDFAVRRSSTYDNTMALMLKEDLNCLGLANPLDKIDIKSNMLYSLWNGFYFQNDKFDDSVTSDSNVFPYSTGVFKEKEMIKSSIKAVVEERLDTPIPLRFSLTDIKEPLIYYLLMKNYQGNIVWTHMGPLFINLVKQFDKKRAVKYKAAYTRVIERYHNYMEVFNPDLMPYTSPFYMSDEGMLWAANYLDL